MKKYILALMALTSLAHAKAQYVKVQLLKSSEAITINKNIYAHFAEHLGRLIYDGLYVGENNTDIPNTDGYPMISLQHLKT